MEYRELVDLVAAAVRMHPSTVRNWLLLPIRKVRGLMIQEEMIVQPDDRTWTCLYSAEAQYFLTAFMKWHRFGARHSMVQVVNFYNDFMQGADCALAWLPKGMRKRFESNLHPGQLGAVQAMPTLALVC